MSVETVRVPDTGSSDPVDVIEVPVQPGDTLNPEDTIVVLESDKATIEVPAPIGGKVARLLVQTGDRVREGDPLMEVETAESSTDDKQTIDKDDTASADNKSSDTEKKPAKKDQSASKASDDKVTETKTDKPGASSQAAKSVSVTIPDLGDIDKAELIELNVAAGDQVEAEQVIAVLESDKASLEIPAPHSGKIVTVKAAIGDQLSTGDFLLEMETDQLSAQSSDQADSQATSEQKTRSKQTDRQQKQESTQIPAEKNTQQSAHDEQGAAPSLAASSGAGASVYAGPAVRKLARQMGVDLSQVKGSGPRQRILKEDLYTQVKSLLSSASSASGSAAVSADLPDIDFSKFGDIEKEELNKLRRSSASNLHRSWITIPHVTQHDEADITELEAFRQAENQRLKKQNVKLTMLAFLVKACASALKAYPRVNSSLENSGDALILKKYIHIGVAVDTPNGLVVPVVRDADQKNIVAIASEVGELAEKARNRKLSPRDMQGGSFSISSLGGIGGTAFTPVVNWPEVAILGVSRSRMQPQWNGDSFQPRLTLPLSLSYDHRVIDGAEAARFTRHLADLLEDMRRVLL